MFIIVLQVQVDLLMLIILIDMTHWDQITVDIILEVPALGGLDYIDSIWKFFLLCPHYKVYFIGGSVILL